MNKESAWYLTFEIPQVYKRRDQKLGYSNYAHVHSYQRGVRIDCVSPLMHSGKKHGVFKKDAMHNGTRSYF